MKLCADGKPACYGSAVTDSTLTKTRPLRAARRAKGLSLSYVAEAAGVDLGHLSRAERGIAGLSVDSLHRVADVVGLRTLAAQLEPFTSEPLDGRAVTDADARGEAAGLAASPQLRTGAPSASHQVKGNGNRGLSEST
jgi:transcriptional regulator with XRE-family HTH domain